MTSRKQYSEKMFGAVTLKYECDCGRWALESQKHCKWCGRDNPDWEGHRKFQNAFSLAGEKRRTMPGFHERGK